MRFTAVQLYLNVRFQHEVPYYELLCPLYDFIPNKDNMLTWDFGTLIKVGVDVLSCCLANTFKARITFCLSYCLTVPKLPSPKRRIEYKLNSYDACASELIDI